MKARCDLEQQGLTPQTQASRNVLINFGVSNSDFEPVMNNSSATNEPD